MVKNEHSLKKNITRVLTANFWVASIGFASSFIFPKILSIESYALFQSFTLYLSYIAILHLGFPSGMVINYAGQNYEDIELERYKSEIKVVLYVLISFTILFVLLFMYSHDKMIGYIAISIIPVGLLGSYKALLQAWGKFKKFSKISTIVATSTPIMALLYYSFTGDLPGDIYISIYLIVNWFITILIIIENFKKTKKVKSAPIFTNQNWLTEKTGLIMVLGNYINTLFVSTDKQFVKFFFGNTEFAFYSFGISMQSLMTIFISSVAQPLFPAMAQNRFQDSEYNKIKNLLISFGSLAGCCYFIAAIIVKSFIKKYESSLDIVGIYFVVFPALAVINCLYINLYKIKGLIRLYIHTLIFMLITAIILNILFINIINNYTGVAIATTITYYIWLFIGIRQFEFLKISIKDIIYLLLYTSAFFVFKKITNDYIGFITNFLFIVILSKSFYEKDLRYLLNRK